MHVLLYLSIKIYSYMLFISKRREKWTGYFEEKDFGTTPPPSPDCLSHAELAADADGRTPLSCEPLPDLGSRAAPPDVR